MWKSVKIDRDENKRQTFAASQRPKSSGSFHIKILFKDNRYTKLANTNDKALSNDQVDKFYLLHIKRLNLHPILLQIQQILTIYALQWQQQSVIQIC